MRKGYRTGRFYVTIRMSRRAAAEAVMRSSPVTRTAPVSSARATQAASCGGQAVARLKRRLGP